MCRIRDHQASPWEEPYPQKQHQHIIPPTGTPKQETEKLIGSGVTLILIVFFLIPNSASTRESGKDTAMVEAILFACIFSWSWDSGIGGGGGTHVLLWCGGQRRQSGMLELEEEIYRKVSGDRLDTRTSGNDVDCVSNRKYITHQGYASFIITTVSLPLQP